MKKEQIETSEYDPTIVYGQSYRFDNYDKKILKELDKDARETLANISKKVGLSRDAIKNRIKKYIDSKMIRAFKPIYNQAKMGFPIVNYVCISLYNPSIEKEKEFVAFMRSNTNITYIASLIGRWDFIIDIMAENPGEFDMIMKTMRQKFPDLIKDYEVFGVIQEHKYEEIGRLIYES